MSFPILNADACRHALKSLLALSAGVSLPVLDEKNPAGHFVHARGRQKYLGMGALVLFFALFAGYGMSHMLASMANVSASGAVITGCVWAVFQWCLERQMIMSIASDASWQAKLAGLSWRSLLACLSAITMVYPFFVDSNRAEIDVRTGEMARGRLIQNVQSAQVAAGLPVLAMAASGIDEKLQKAEENLRSEAPDMAALRAQLHLCRDRLKEEERKAAPQLAVWKQQLSAAAASGLSEGRHWQDKIDAMQAKIHAAKARCQQYEMQVSQRLITWKNEKLAEKNQLMEDWRDSRASITSARQRSTVLEEEQAKKIDLAAHAGFAADFAATWDMLKNDMPRRLQFIWWLLWFLTIEMVAIIIKFSSHTDLDARLSADEKLVKLDIAQTLGLQEAQMDITRLRNAMQDKGEQDALHADDGKSQAALSTIRQLIRLEEQAQQAGQESKASTSVHVQAHVQAIVQQTTAAIHARFLGLLAAK
ncbi:DUF4407 domain-containing protein [Undibacterium sp. TJN19]|uniref:DUF4407 domain-containing protein n=1 Tax=Undibacterium sp. TJN19 TaxID=3413055 RepID=UPI003BF3003E